MRITKIIFWTAAVYGIAVLLPGLFMEASLVPPLSHPEFYYGFYGVALVFQFVFILIAGDPVRYRPLTMILWAHGRVTAGGTLFGAAADGLLMLLFISTLFISRIHRQPE
jgi:hypothetical protein